MIASNDSFVIAAYAVTWVVLLAYLWRLARRGSSSPADNPASGRRGEQ